LIALRLKVFWVRGHKEVTLIEFFEGLTLSESIKDVTIPLGPYSVCYLQAQCKTAEEVKATLHAEYTQPTESEMATMTDVDDFDEAKEYLSTVKPSLTHLVTRNASMAPSWDSAVFVNDHSNQIHGSRHQ
jgi:hypothetical protein